MYTPIIHKQAIFKFLCLFWCVSLSNQLHKQHPELQASLSTPNPFVGVPDHVNTVESLNGKGIVKRLKKKHFNASSKHGRKGPGFRKIKKADYVEPEQSWYECKQ